MIGVYIPSSPDPIATERAVNRLWFICDLAVAHL